MIRFAALSLVFCLLLSGCQFLGDRIKEPVTYYYVHASYQENLNNVVLSEEREASGHREDLSYLLALYLMGPVSDQLISPIPPGTRIHVNENTGENVTLSLSDMDNTMTDAQFSLACACLTYTCIDITGAKAITINSGTRSVTMTMDNLSLLDNYHKQPTEDSK